MPSSKTSFQIQMPNNETCIFSNSIQFKVICFCILLPYRQWNVPAGAAAAHSGKVKDKRKTNFFPEATFNV